MRRFTVSPLLVVLLITMFQTSSLAQTRPPSGGAGGTGTPPVNNPTPTNAPNNPRPTVPNPNNFPSMDMNRPIYLRGKVILDQGGQISEPVPIQRVCGATAHREGYTDTHGNFSILVGDNSNFQDASESGSFGNRPTNISSRQLWNCEIRATLPGYTSSAISLAGRDFNDMSGIGNIVLSKIGGGEGNSISVTSLKAPDKAKSEYQKALASYDQKKYAEAEKHLAKALTVYPQYASAWELRGREQQHQKQDAEAINSFQAAIAADEKFVSPYIKLAALMSMKNDWAEVLRLTDRALQLDPTSYPDAWLFNGAAHYNLKHYPQAERAAAKAVNLDKEHRFPRAELLMASLFQMKGNNAAAAEHFRAFLKLEPQSAEAQQIHNFLAKYDQQTASAKPAPTAQAEPQKQ
jgi:tetratricopeptide (TPR) repeat protein